MAKYLLFDLDGTLLPLDTELFITTYMKSIAGYFSHLFEPDAFVKQIMASSHAMISDLDPARTNEEKFMADFFAKIDREQAEMLPLFAEYYETSYSEVRSAVQHNPLARSMVEEALARGQEIVLATNPIFPRAAVEKRMEWAGIADLPWRLVTSYEDSHFCKPHAQYFAEVLERIGAKPEECIHVGNDLEEDLVAAKLGIRVAIADDYLIDTREEQELNCAFRGSLAEVALWLADGTE